MAEVILNNALAVTAPEGFKDMDADVMRKAFGKDNPNCWSIRDEDRHIIFSVLWHQASGIMFKLAGDVYSIAKSTEKKIYKQLRSYDYESNGITEEETAGCKSATVHYEYTVSDIRQSARTVVFLHNKCCYTVYYYGRKALEEQSLPIIEEFLSSLHFVD